MRIDAYLCQNGITVSRNEAKSLLLAGAVSVNGKAVLKPSYDVIGDEEIKVDKSLKPFVSRGGIKLDGALTHFHIDVKGKKCLDVGASSGGFTDCLLKRGAEAVIAVDSGKDQLVESVRNNARVTTIEGYNARFMKREDFAFSPEIVVMDVSFISATYIIPAISACILDGGVFLCLIKPQFEVGRANIGKGGIVKDEKARAEAVEKVVSCATEHGFSTVGVVRSDIKGGDGNVEFIGCFKKNI